MRLLTRFSFWPTGVLLIAACVQGTILAAEHAAFNAARASITSSELQQFVETLADDVFEGREAGSRGGHAAARYIVKRLEQLSVTPAGIDGQFFQMFHGNFRNLLAVIEGSDPALRNEYILVGAHYDHVGYGTPNNSFGPIGYIHNGADDNASGTAALLELIEALLQLPRSPKRSVLIAFWDGEEKGLLGSRYWVRNPTVPLEKVRLAVNLDMIGRLRDGRLDVGGTRTAHGLRRLVSEANSDGEIWLDFTWKIESNSDHWSFYEQDVPYVQLHTGLHKDYHRPSDDANLVNVDGMRHVAQFLFGLVVALADADELPAFRPMSHHESTYDRRRLESPPQLAPRLGVTWQPDAESPAAGSPVPDLQAPGVVVAAVTLGSPADQAGVRAGDRILALGERQIDSGEKLQSLVLSATGETPLAVARPGEDRPRELTVILPAEPIRVGLSWRVDEAEPGVVLVTRVMPGSPAAAAGLQPRDRIYQIDGQDFADSHEFHDLLSAAADQLALLVERKGHIETMQLTLPSVETAN